MTAIEHFIRSLEERGVQWMATLCGHGLDPLFHAARNAGLRLVDTRNEQTASYMAEAYARLTRKPGVVAVSSGVAHANAAGDGIREGLEQQVRTELAKLPYFGVFDNLAFSVNENDQVTLSGQVTRPTLKRDAENIIKRIEGVSAVDNQVEVLPLSSYDNHIRLNAYYAIFGSPSLNRYAIMAQPPIHIVVKNGAVTLEGVVNNEMDRQLADARVRGLPGTFEVTNHLQLDSRE
jgi:hyperosmotically inducible protein